MKELLILDNFTTKDLLAFTQNQFVPLALPTSCSSFSFSIMINLLTRALSTTGEELDHYLIHHGYKLKYFGIPSFQLPMVLKGLMRFVKEKRLVFPYQAEYHSFSHLDTLIENLLKGIPTIIEVSWGNTMTVIRDLFHKGPASAVGHYMVLCAYDPKKEIFTFLDPGNGTLSSYASSTLQQIWLDQPNLFIKKGSAVIFIHA